MWYIFVRRGSLRRRFFVLGASSSSVQLETGATAFFFADDQTCPDPLAKRAFRCRRGGAVVAAQVVFVCLFRRFTWRVSWEFMEKRVSMLKNARHI